MSRFKRIKNKSNKKSSVSIDEKIAALDKELEKTGMLSEITNSTSGVYSRSQFVPAQDAVISNVPDGNGLVTGTWTQPVGTAFGGGSAGSFPTSFPKFWNNAGYRTPVSGIVNTDNLHGDGANLGVAKMPNNGEPFDTEVSPALKAAGAVGGFMKYSSGFNAGWRSGYMTGGTRDSGGGTFTAYDGQSTGGRYPITHLGVQVNPTSHPHLFRAVQYWHPFSIFNPDIDARWPLGDVGPKYTGVVTEIDGVKYALFTAYKWIGDGANTYTAQVSRPATTLLIQRRGIGDINYAGPITNYGLFGLSKQGFGYIDNRSKRRGGVQKLRGGPIYRKAGSGRGGKITSISRQLVPYGRGGKVSSRGVGNYLRGRGVGFSPKTGRVAQNVAKELPPKPTPAEIRNETVKQFRENGDNYAANKFYTEDRISELESKDNLTSREQSELDQLKVNAVHMNQNPPPPKPAEIETNIESINTSLANGDIDAFANAVANASVPSTIETAFDTNNDTHRALSEMSPDQLERALESLEFKTPNPVSVMWKSLVEHYKDGGGVLDAETRTGFGNKLAIAKAVITGEDVNVTSGDIADSEKQKYVSSLRPEDFGTNIQINNGVVGYVDDNIIENPDGTTRPNTEGIESVTNDFNYDTSIGNFGQNHTQFVVPDGVTLEMLKNGEGWDKTKVSMRDYAYANKDKLKDPAARAEEFGPYAWAFQAAQFLGNLNPFNKGTEGKPENISAAAKTTFEQSGDTLSEEQKAAIIASMEKNGVNNIENPLDDKVANPPSTAEKQKEKDYEKNRRKNRYSKPKGSNADKFPPPKQSSIFANEDGILTKYYTKSIFTGRDGKTYKSVLVLPYLGDNDDGSPRFGSLWSPGSYTTNIPLFDTPMDEPLGDYVPPDDLPDIPFTPPEPEPDNRKDYEKNRDRQRKFRFRNSYEPKGDVLSEEAKLGHFEPKALNVDLEKLRKGIMPEYPEKPPAEMIDGYHQDSKIKPKEQPKDAYLKLNPEDLIRNHRLKKKEADEMMKTIDRINAHIEAHPEDLIHAQMRYPVDDPRLAELNWKMDQMLEAGEEYLDSNFKENQTLYKRATDRTKKNIKLTDPEYVQQHYDELRGTTKPKKTKLVGRLGKHLNKYESKSFFKHVNSEDFKKVSERKMERDKQKAQLEEHKNQVQKEIQIEYEQTKNDWRKDLGNNTY